ncbi:MAG TPA: hypothetical protein VGE01_04380, partial [Fimbriimonas sp.]
SSVLLTGFSVIQYRRTSQTESETLSMRSQTAAIQARIEETKGQLLLKEATVPAASNEESNFISALKSTAKDSQVVIVKWTVVTNANTEATEANKSTTNTKEKDLLLGVTPMGGQLEIEGDYRSVLRFTDRLLSAPRLYNLSFVSLIRGDEPNKTRMSMMVTRYVEQPQAPVTEGQKA